MNILITGAKGFLGCNLVENLKAIKEGKNRTRPGIKIDEIFEYDIDSDPVELDYYCRNAEFVFHLAGVNRPVDPKDFRKGNVDLISMLIDSLKKNNNLCPVMLSSSIQAALIGRFAESEYGLSKDAGEKLFFEYAEKTGIKLLVYRFPNIAGKWCKPNYNSAIATFCNNIANEQPVEVTDPEIELEVVFIDDLIEEMYNALEGREHRCDYPAAGTIVDGHEYNGLTPIWTENGRYCGVTVTHKITLGEIVRLLKEFHEQSNTLMMPNIPTGSFKKKLYSMYISYLPKERIAFDLKMNIDERGSFTELLKTADHGQFSVNVTKPGLTKGQHWHNSKWEFFIVVSGQGLIRERRIGTDEIIEFRVSGDNIQAVHMLPGCTHSITNLSETEDLITVMWANELFDNNKPDTISEEV